jgi:CII-binding regulator of phage lambda lysogenization HflD
MRRRRSIEEPRSQAHHADSVDARLLRAERRLDETTKALEQLTKRLTTLEAEVDYIASKVRPS